VQIDLHSVMAGLDPATQPCRRWSLWERASSISWRTSATARSTSALPAICPNALSSKRRDAVERSLGDTVSRCRLVRDTSLDHRRHTAWNFT